MKKKIMTGVTCALVVLLLAAGGYYLLSGAQEGNKNDDMISDGTEKKIESDEQTKPDNKDENSGTKSGLNSDTAANPKDDKNNAQADDTAELPIDVIEDDDIASSKPSENSGNQSDEVVPDNGNELPVDWID